MLKKNRISSFELLIFDASNEIIRNNKVAKLDNKYAIFQRHSSNNKSVETE